MCPVDTSLFDRDRDLLRQRHGPESVHRASEQIPVDRIPVPLPEIMRITSTRDANGKVIAGIPIGRVTRLWGDASTGKTMLAYMMIAAAQQFRSERFPNGLKCMYHNIEGQFDPVYASRLGVDLDLLELSHLTLIEDIAGEMELVLGSVHLHVLDSASFATPMGEIVGPKGSKRPEYDVYSQPGLHARAWKYAINRIHHRMDKDENVVIVIDHAAQDRDTHVDHALSGKRMEFRSDLSIHLKKGSHLYYNKRGRLDTYDRVKEELGKDPRGQKQADGTEVKIKVNKSRVCRPFRVGAMRLDLNSMHFDRAWELAEASRTYDDQGEPAHRSGRPAIVKENGNWYRAPGYDKAVQGIDGLCHLIEGDPVLQQEIQSKMMAGV